MNRIILGIFGVTVAFAVGQALECYKCDLGIWGVCITTKVNCSLGEQCFHGVGKAARYIDIEEKGCLKTDECNKEIRGEIFKNDTAYTMNRTCCDTDLCNTAPSLPPLASLSLTLATLTSTLAASALL